jgi:hypothetical protein
MSEEIKWNIGKEGTIHTRLDVPPFRAFYWLRDGEIIESADFDKQELEAELHKRRAIGQDTALFEQALKRLL